MTQSILCESRTQTAKREAEIAFHRFSSHYNEMGSQRERRVGSHHIQPSAKSRENLLTSFFISLQHIQFRQQLITNSYHYRCSILVSMNMMWVEVYHKAFFHGTALNVEILTGAEQKQKTSGFFYSKYFNMELHCFVNPICPKMYMLTIKYLFSCISFLFFSYIIKTDIKRNKGTVFFRNG